MATQTFKLIIQFRRDTSDNWQLHRDIVPAAGEPCYELDTHVLKIGDGKTPYGDLPAINGAGVTFAGDGKSIVVEDRVFKLMGYDAAEIGAYPVKTEAGIEWVMPAKDISAELKTKVDTLQAEVEAMQEILTPSQEGVDPLLARVETLESDVDALEGDINEFNTTIEDTVQRIVTQEVADQIDDFATKITDDGTVNTVKELFDYVANHGGELATIVGDVNDLKVKVGEDTVATQIEAAINPLKDVYLSKEQASATVEHVKYEIAHKPVGTLVDYRDKEIRVMIPSDVRFTHQTSGAGADANNYYIGFQAYAPNGAMSFKEDIAEIIVDNTMYYFEDNEFAGIDEFGRKYSVVWLPVANYADGVWTYYGQKSTKDHYIGWYYSVEWYNADGLKIGADTIRINLSNEDCHGNVEPFYMGKVVKGVKFNGTLMDAIDGVVDINIKGSDEIEIAEDGTINIKSISFDKIVQSEAGNIVFDGGGAAG